MPTVRAVNPRVLLRLAYLCAVLLAAAAPARAQPLEGELAVQVQQFALEATRQSGLAEMRVKVSVGRLDPRLRLAPCVAVQPYLPTGTRLWGAARIGLRCTDDAVRWNVFLPIQVDVFGPALVANAPLVAGHVLNAEDLRITEVNLTATRSLAITRHELAVGRALSRPLGAGEALRAADLRARLWFAAGDNVRLVAAGSGWRINGEGQALAAGIEGQKVRVRTESGRVVSGVAVAERLVEVTL